ncbi:hypothetical protein ANCCEY_02835 [Ancylostoma ceylanicum]|uniref:Uncharacterized protein n=1 Tax=Ancylostoma ceylanicum TaxID=53326 RepID=A0A0D6MBV9_9BILA|nr:hypothetical protein ANCCEY_02835 [Ancylostoma ceylanicum]
MPLHSSYQSAGQQLLDLNRFPQNVMPALIEDHEEEDESDVEQDDIEEDKYLKLTNRTDEEIFLCEENAYLTATQVRCSPYYYALPPYPFHDKIGVGTETISWAFLNESREAQRVLPTLVSANILQLIDPEAQRAAPKRFKSIGDVKRYYGDHVNEVEKMLRLFLPSTYQEVVLADVIRMDRIVELMTQVNYNLDLNYAQRLAFEEVEHLLPFQYETGRLQRRAWAEKMQSKRMRHFFEDDFFEVSNLYQCSAVITALDGVKLEG